MKPYDSAGKYYNDKPSTHCKCCGRELRTSGEFDTCTNCKVKELNAAK